MKGRFLKPAFFYVLKVSLKSITLLVFGMKLNLRESSFLKEVGDVGARRILTRIFQLILITKLKTVISFKLPDFNNMRNRNFVRRIFSVR